MRTPEAEDSLSAHVQEGFFGVKRGGGGIRISDLHPQASGVGPISAVVGISWGGSMDQSGVKRETR